MADAVNDFVTREIMATDSLVAVLDEWRSLRRELDARGGAVFLASGPILGSNDHVTVQAALDAFNAIDAIETALAAGHLTNLYKLLPFDANGVG